MLIFYRFCLIKLQLCLLAKSSIKIKKIRGFIFFLRCVGTPLHLKNKYGNGYRINILAESEDVVQLKQLVSDKLSGSFNKEKSVFIFLRERINCRKCW